MANADIAIHQQQFARTVPLDGISIREDVAFSNHKGVEKASLHKRNLAALEKLRPALARFLQPDEVVLYIARGRTPLTILEQLTAGWWTYFLAAAAVVITNQRILFFPINNDGTWKESVRTVLWGDVASITAGGLITRNLTFTFRNGEKQTYMAFRLGDAKKVTLIAQTLIPVSTGEMSPTHGMVQLCPDCRNALTPGVYACRSCGLIFKDEKSMLVRSILIPAGGYFYTGHPMIAFLPALVEVIVVLNVLGLILIRSRDPNAAENLAGALIVLFVYWVLETAVTILHCRRYIREYIPLKRTRVPADQTLAANGSASFSEG